MIYHGDAFSYILETPQVLKKIMENQDNIFRESMQTLSDRKITEIYLVGSGSSYHSAVAVVGFLQNILGVRVFALYPAAFMEEMNLVSEALLLGISQQGTSLGVIRAMDKMRQSGGTAISITGEYQTEITRHSDANIYVACGYEDAGATTKGYTASVLTLFLFGLQLAQANGSLSMEEQKHDQERLRHVIANMDNLLEQSKIWCVHQAMVLKNCRDLIVIASENQKSTLLEIVLKFSETCRFPVRGYETEEFMHGMYNAVNKETEFLYLFPMDAFGQKNMQNLYDYYEKQGNRQYAVNRRDGNFLHGCFTEKNAFFVLEITLPLQMLFVLTSRERGIDLNIPRDPEFHKYMNSKIEK